MPRMRALQSHPWGHDKKLAGEEYEASDQEATLLVALDWAERAEESKQPVRRGPGRPRKVMDADAPTGYLTK